MVTKVALKRIFYLSSCSGFFPLTQEGLLLEFSRKKFCLGAVLVLILFGETAAMVMRISYSLPKWPLLLNALYISSELFLNSLPIVSFVQACLRSSSLNESIRKIDAADNSLRKIPLSADCGYVGSGSRVRAYCAIYILMLLSEGSCISPHRHSWSDSFKLLYYYLPMLPTIFLVDQIVCLIDLLGRRFETVCRPLAHLPNAMQLEVLVAVRDELVDATGLVCTYSEHQVINIFAASLYYQVSGVFRLVEFFKNENNAMDATCYLINVSCWMLLYTMFLWNITSTVGTVVKQAKEFDTMLYQLILEDRTGSISDNLKINLHIAMNREVVFTPCGLFKMDYPLLHSMAAAVTTYLVILLQFSDPSNSPVS